MDETTSERIHREAQEEAAKRGHRLIDDLSDAEFRAAANHTWLNAFSCVNPTDEFLIQVGRGVINALNDSDLVDSLIGRCKHVILTFNKS